MTTAADRRKKDKPPIWVRREPGTTTLKPVTLYDQDRIAELPTDRNLRADFRQDRSPPHHRFYWGLMGHVAKATGLYDGDASQLHRWVKLKLGLVETIRLHDGSEFVDLMSTAWAAMDQIEFKVYFERVLNLLLSEVLPGITRRQLLKPVEKMLGLSEDRVWQAAA